MAEKPPESLMDREERLVAYEGEDRVISSLEKEESLGKIVVPDEKFYSKIPRLDKIIDGFEPGELVTVSGRTGDGKTLLTTTLTETFVRDRVKSLWFSYEMTPKQFFKRFPTLPEFYLPNHLTDKALPWIEDRIIEAKIKYNIKAMFVDHLHFLVDMARLKNASLEIGSIVRQLKTMSIKHNIITFLIAHIGQLSKPRRPTMDDIRDSSFIKSESDIVLMIWRLKDKKTGQFLNEARIGVDKNRREGIVGKTAKVAKIDGYLREVSDEPEREYTNPLGE